MRTVFGRSRSALSFSRVMHRCLMMLFRCGKVFVQVIKGSKIPLTKTAKSEI
jgi:hypothetical protein